MSNNISAIAVRGLFCPSGHTHWLRLALFTAYAALVFWMTLIALDPKKTPKSLQN